MILTVNSSGLDERQHSTLGSHMPSQHLLVGLKLQDGSARENQFKSIQLRLKTFCDIKDLYSCANERMSAGTSAS